MYTSCKRRGNNVEITCNTGVKNIWYTCVIHMVLVIWRHKWKYCGFYMWNTWGFVHMVYMWICTPGMHMVLRTWKPYGKCHLAYMLNTYGFSQMRSQVEILWFCTCWIHVDMSIWNTDGFAHMQHMLKWFEARWNENYIITRLFKAIATYIYCIHSNN